jgi:hypothetical protein
MAREICIDDLISAVQRVVDVTDDWFQKGIKVTRRTELCMQITHLLLLERARQLAALRLPYSDYIYVSRPGCGYRIITKRIV